MKGIDRKNQENRRERNSPESYFMRRNQKASENTDSLQVQIQTKIE